MTLKISNGLVVSKIVFEHFKEMYYEEEFDKFEHVCLGCFTNCRECGYTFMCMAKNGETFTFCVYEHRNSDQIIINGKEGYVSLNGDLPYNGDSKFDYLKSFSYNQHYQVAEELLKMIKVFFSENKYKKVK